MYCKSELGIFFFVISFTMWLFGASTFAWIDFFFIYVYEINVEHFQIKYATSKKVSRIREM